MEKTNLKVRRVPIDSLQIDHDYARYHSSKNLEAIEQSLCRFGQIDPLIVQAKNGRVINGNGRLLVMKKLGWIECEVVELEVGDARAARIRAGLNQTIDYLAEQVRGLD